MNKKRGFALLFIVFILILFLCSFLISAQQEQEKIQIKRAYLWLKNKAIGRWQNLNIEQHVFSLLVLRDEMSLAQTKASKIKLIDKSFENETCWPSPNCKTKDTALAKLALDAIGEDTEKANEWLLNKTAMPTGIDWYLQLTTNNVPARCLLFYDNTDYEISIDKEDKLGGNPGSCFTIAENYWLSLSPECSDKIFNVSCNESVIANFLFKKENDWYVPGLYEEAGPQGLLSIGLNSSCITTLGSCDYEASLWTAYAFMKQGKINTAKTFMPYLVINYDENLQYMPQPFLYEITKKQSFISELIALQRADGLWLGQGSSNKYYDTALVVLMTQAMAGDIEKTKETLLEEQKQDGSWECSGSACDNVRDTALILLGVWPTLELLSECEQYGYSCVINCSNSGGISQPYACFGDRECCDIAQSCEDKYGSCKSSCSDNETEVPYICEPGLKCCKPYDKSMCINEIGGQICGSGQKCLDNLGNIIPFIVSADTPYCCKGVCTTASDTCFDLGGEICDPSQGKSCPSDRWIVASDTNYCCESGFCTGSQTCAVMGGEICASDEDCKDGTLVEAANTGGQQTCCIQGGKCIPKTCPGVSCEAGQICSGTMYETSEATRCCVDGSCLSSCSSLGGTACNASLACDGTIVEASDTSRCCLGKCKKPSVFPWLTTLIIFLVLGLGVLIFLSIKKRKKAKPAKPKLEFPGMMPSRPVRRMPPGRAPARPVRMPAKPIARPIKPKPMPIKPVRKPKPLPPAPKPS
ncbi:MAG: hypothetical protein IB618_00175 [Candidatus Pacearchaeota archaeon]|nr:MAG: hypothetical protein IB618_00175 [Candidatus Pacearchaeota archaeon]